MLKLVLFRLAGIVPLLFVVAVATYYLGDLSDVDPAEFIVGEQATEEQLAAVRAERGLDRSVNERFGDWLGGAVQGDLGTSIYTGASVTALLRSSLPTTASLTLGALFFGIVAGVPAGLIAALRAGRLTDRVVSAVATAGQAIPGFWLGLLLIVAFALRLPWFPAVGYVGPTTDVGQWLRSITLPSIALGSVVAAIAARQTRSAMIGVLQQEYIRTALAKGLTKRRVVVKHALKNAAAPVLTVLAFQATALLGGAIVIERLFALPGFGKLTIESTIRRDADVIQGVVLVTVAFVVLINIVLDAAYAWVNPKVRPS